MANTARDFLISMLQIGYLAWNSIIDVAMTLFTTSPTAAAGGVYATAHNLFNAIRDISLPIAIVFFLIAILKDVTSSPPDQQVRMFFNDTLKFGIMVGILNNLWTIMGAIIQIADGIATSLGGAGSYHMSLPGTISSALSGLLVDPTLTADIFAYIGELFLLILYVLVVFILSVVNIGILVASSISILSCAFQRVIKPLVLLPFACITVAFAAGKGDTERVATSYLKTFFAFCISGAFMVICISLGTALGSGLLSISTSGLHPIAEVTILLIENSAIPMIIAGLVKSADSVLAKFL